jgi:hypothetical protein
VKLTEQSPRGLLIYCTIRELVRVLGGERIIRMFFKTQAPPGREE